MYKKFILVVVLLAGLTLFAQTASATTYMVYGRVTNGSDNNDLTNGIPNALISFITKGSGGNYYTSSDAYGYFQVQITATGNPGHHFHVFCVASGYSFNDLLLEEDDPQFLNFYSL